ncbi:MAG TPA: glycosyltransferase [Dinghuibacter sp.]|uniref:glycosyltransferase family 2 protein n=1 Tax=Dinghuibacter sp. TaxID=2024697 RepID=UPI002B6ED0ED|nr:glycosyltransferase [Dinghuibacter sp.]HTJ10971.1 glycosyltransferase [Dinghuibacter sp.]
MDTPLVSVIMNCYNSSEYLKEAIDSVVSQTYQHWEIIFWDNQSTDKSAEIFKGYADNRFRYFYAERHTPLSEGRNLAIARATGEYLAFLDCDDLWAPEKLEAQMAFFTKNPEVGIVYTPFEILLNSDSQEVAGYNAMFLRLRYEGHGPEDIYRRLLFKNYIIFSSVVLRKSVFDRTDGFSDDYRQNEDYEILLKCARLSLGACTAAHLVRYRLHASNNTLKNDERNFLETRSIYAGLPRDKYVTEAISRNEVRFGLYRLIYQKRIDGLKLFFQRHSLRMLYQILRQRYFEKGG